MAWYTSLTTNEIRMVETGEFRGADKTVVGSVCYQIEAFCRGYNGRDQKKKSYEFHGIVSKPRYDGDHVLLSKSPKETM
jgi:hypothetical protein